VTRHPRIVVRAVTWNLFHGRDDPPDPALATWRSRILRVTERNATHVQVNRPLLAEFAALLAGLPWEVALLQEVPPRWLRPLGRASAASGASALTSRNFPHLARTALARLNPDLIASHEGGSNVVLARAPWWLVEVARETIARHPERRRMLLVRLREPSGRELVVANLHASTGGKAREVLAAAERAAAWSGEAPLLFGGDLNLRPGEAPDAFGELERRHGLSGVTSPGAIDHLLARGLSVLDEPRAVPPEARERQAEGVRAIRLSDHSPVVATFEVG
jgi:endonuclease/exonuclease/phosphatase family metal-dependent hydrolase